MTGQDNTGEQGPPQALGLTSVNGTTVLDKSALCKAYFQFPPF